MTRAGEARTYIGLGVSAIADRALAFGRADGRLPFRHRAGRAPHGAAQWRVVPGFPDYEISDLGRLRKGTTEIATSPYSVRYRKAALFVGGRRHDRAIHHLVLEAFVGPRPKGFHCCHLNSCPLDNRLVNLRWASAAENESHKPGRIPLNKQAEITVASGTQVDIAARFNVSIYAVQRLKTKARLHHPATIADATKPVTNHFGEGGVAKGATGFATHRGPSKRPSDAGL